jgi:membrane protease YdiL (CAAX protease family)
MKKILRFLLITFFWSWTFFALAIKSISAVLDQNTFQSFILYFFIGVYGPTIGAIVTSMMDSKSVFIDLIKKFFNFKIPLKILLLIFFLPVLFVATGIAIFSILGGKTGPLEFKGVYTIPSILLAGIYAGPLGEELGWRGFLLPELQKISSPLKSSLIIGIIWFCWHIPLFWAPVGTLVSGNLSITTIIIYLLIINCLSIIITWLYNQSSNNLWTAILFHLFINAGVALTIFPQLISETNKIHLYSCLGMLLFSSYIMFAKMLIHK